MRWPTDTRGAVGGVGVGKSTLFRCLVHAGVVRDEWQFVIVDLNEEPWGEGSPVFPTRCKTPGGVRKALASGRKLVIVTPDMEDVDDEDDARAWIEEIAGACVDEPRGPRQLVIPDLHEFARSGRPVPSRLRRLLLRPQHENVRCGVWWDTQLPAELRLSFLRATSLLYMFASGVEDDVLRKLGGDGLVVAVRECGRRFAEQKHGGDDEPGWYVRVMPQQPRPAAYDLHRADLPNPRRRKVGG